MLRLAGAVGGAIQKLAGNFLAGQLALPDKLAQGILGADVKQVVQLLAELSRWRIADQRCGGGEEGAGGREPHGPERPQPVLIEVDEFLKGVVAAPMGVAGAVREFLELAKRGASGAGTERRHYRSTWYYRAVGESAETAWGARASEGEREREQWELVIHISTGSFTPSPDPTPVTAA